jgi:hypothetical protein
MVDNQGITDMNRPDPNWEIVARAVCNMEGTHRGLKNKALEKYIQDNYQDKISALQLSYQEHLARQGTA